MAVCQRVNGEKGGGIELRGCHLPAIQEEVDKWSKSREEGVSVEIYKRTNGKGRDEEGKDREEWRGSVRYCLFGA